MTPADYAARYTSLKVDLGGGASATVNIRKYHIGKPLAAKDALWSKLTEYFHKQKKANPSFALTLRVNGGNYEVSHQEKMPTWIVRPFTGKGNPEHFQVVLQLAVLLGEARADTLQAYCDKNLGLDCNGFVGNYLYYDQDAHDWMDEPRNGEGGPNDDMTGFDAMGKPVKSTADMNQINTYICLETRGGKLIPGGASGAGHIAITQANRFMPQSFVFNSFGGLDLGMARKHAYGHRAFWAVESAGGLGLTQSWYAFPNSKNPGGVHNIFRGCKGSWLEMKVVDLGVL